MTIEAAEATGRLNIGAALQDWLSALGRNIVPFGVLGLILAGAPAALLDVGKALAPANDGYVILEVLGAAANLVARPILYGAIIHGTLRHLDGERVSIGDCLAAGRRRWGSMLGLMIWTGLLSGLGLIFLIVPGVILALRWAVAGPMVVTGSRGIQDCMERSARLTKGQRWPMFLFCLVICVALVCLIAVAGVIEAGATAFSPSVWSTLLLAPLITVSMELSFAAAAAVMFHRLRGDREGPAVATLSEVFA